MKHLTLTLLSVIIFFLSGCKDKKPEVVWRNYLDRVGTSSSPHCVDLTGDGTLDIIIGAGKNEYEASDSAVIAFDGSNGNVIWTTSGVDQIIGSPLFLKINDDDVPDIIIGGRSCQLMAIDGRNGRVFWRFETPNIGGGALKHFKFGFYSPQKVPDQDGDGVDDLLVTNGGNPKAEPFSEKGRHAGILTILSARSGRILAADTMPDGKETYMSPVLYDFEGEGKLSIIFGTGGETIGGKLYVARIQDLVSSQLKNAIAILEREEKGFMAPPVLSDVNKDGIRDIICNWFGGEVIAIDGNSREPLWMYKIPNAEMYNTVTPGHVNEDGVPDFFNTFNKGTWPVNTGTIHVIIDGASGRALYKDSIGCSGYASALSYDLSGDGYDEFIWNTNEYSCEGLFNGLVSYQLVSFNYREQKVKQIIPKVNAKNVSTTPWLGDLDGDGKLDLINCIQQNTTQIHTYFGIQIQRTEFDIPINKKLVWGEYMGLEGTCIY